MRNSPYVAGLQRARQGPDGNGQVVHVKDLRICAVDWDHLRSGSSWRQLVEAVWMMHLWESRPEARTVVRKLVQLSRCPRT